MREPDTCTDCPHFSNTQKHAHAKMIQKRTPDFLIELNPKIEEAVDNALIILDNGDPTRAEQLIAPLLEEHPLNHLVHYAMGCVYAFTERSRESIPYFKKSVEIFPYFEEGWNNLGNAYLKTGKAHHTIICARKVIELGAPSDALVKNWQRLIKKLTQSFAEDGLTLDEYIANAELFEQAYDHMQNGKVMQAKQSFLKVLTLEKNHVQTHGNLAICYAMLGDKKNALSYIDKALELDPDYELARANRPVLVAMKDGEKLTTPPKTVEYYSTGMTPISN